ncbi:Uncharacterised protein [Mycolicibacterium vanbaalenii]|uniref:Tat pathway signal protein n=2 Tax=Mycolicibacterium vanbaalenii TaxID=110539 RepID=A0A5S9NHF1_MYCVN|nr:Uncharacterised protein [Mycolicibacterium vanbaalenii]
MNTFPGPDTPRYASVRNTNDENRCDTGDGPLGRRGGNGRMLLVPSRSPILTRRRVLAGGASLALFAATTATSVACGTAPPPPDLDELTTALDRARADSRLATDVAASARGPVAAALTEVAAERAAHAEALDEEIVRMTGHSATTTSVTTTPTTSPTSSTVPPSPTAEDVIGALRVSADSAAQAAAALSGYRAGLLASISAACTAAFSVALTPIGGTR